MGRIRQLLVRLLRSRLLLLVHLKLLRLVLVFIAFLPEMLQVAFALVAGYCLVDIKAVVGVSLVHWSLRWAEQGAINTQLKHLIGDAHILSTSSILVPGRQGL